MRTKRDVTNRHLPFMNFMLEFTLHTVKARRRFRKGPNTEATAARKGMKTYLKPPKRSSRPGEPCVFALARQFVA